MFLLPIATILAAVQALHAQSATAPLLVTATVISTCTVDVPRSAEQRMLSTLPVAVTCAHRGAAARVQRPAVPQRTEVQVRDAVLTINF
jgi:hypothetical protein